ncbi:MAG TPA: DUF4157 domain-containing protein [Parafilimonas sp.]|nr:DUF4157 domain-containing protein [Parafilimonas sp.]
MNVYIKTNSALARLAARILKTDRMAVTVRRTIYLHNCSKEEFLKNKNWVCHEVVHVRQYKQLGTFAFLAAYLFQCLINGYNNNKFEKEARKKESNHMMMDGVEFI